MAASLYAMVVVLLTCSLSLSSALTLSVSGTNATAGSNQVVMCAVDAPASGVAYTFQWHRGTVELQASRLDPTYVLQVQVTDAGDDYRCVVFGDDMMVGYKNWTLRVTIPNFDWKVAKSSLFFYVGLNLAVTFASLLESVGGVMTIATIQGPNGVIASGMEGDRVRTFNVEMVDDFEKVVHFYPLSAGDRGMYTCSGTVVPTIPNDYVTNGMGERSTDILSIPIPVPVISLDVATPPSSPQRLLDIPPFNLLTLSCSAEVKVRRVQVSFNMTFSWQRSVGSSTLLESLPSNTFTNAIIFGSMATSVLSINTTHSGNHTYSCHVTLDVNPAPDNITANNTQMVTVFGPALPAPPVDLTTPTVRHDRVNMEWRVSLLTYDSETYHVIYGTNQSNLSSDSDAISATSIELTDLMVSATYYFRIVATNSVGATASDTSNFTTSLRPPSPPVMLDSRKDGDTLTTYTFFWTLPTDEQGQIRVFRLTCMPTQLGVANTSSVVVDGSNASARLTGLSYLVTYSCMVQAGTNLIYFDPSNTINVTVTEGVPDVVSCGSGRWVSVTILSQQAGVANVTIMWVYPGDARGILLTYSLSFTTYDGYLLDNVTIDASMTSYNFTALPLEPGVPYNVSVLARNSFASSPQPCYFTDFLQQLSPPSVTGLDITRLSGSEARVSWIVPSLLVARGFLSYTIEFVPSVTGRIKKRQNGGTCTVSPCSVPVQLGGVTLTDLDPLSSYTITVRAVNEDGVQGESTTGTVEPETELVPKSPLLTIVLAVICLLVVLLLLLLLVIWCCLRHRKAEIVKRRPYDELELSKTTDYRHDTDVSKDRAPFYAPVKMSERVQPILTSNFSMHVKEMHTNRDKLFEMEYESFGSETSSCCDIAKMNKSKNRFANIFPYDFSRVKLEAIEGMEGSDYINASYIDGYGQLNAYIAAQGPMPNTVGDFWRMIWEHKLSTVVMLTKVTEGGKKKCESYWPERVSEKLVPPGTSLQVTFIEMMPFADYEIRKFEVLDVSHEGVPLPVTHYQFLGWPDHGVPKFATSLIEFNRRVKHEYQPGQPILVHCSAGVGRTGTYITLDAMLERMKVEDSICVYDFVGNMRAKRVFMVQTQVGCTPSHGFLVTLFHYEHWPEHDRPTSSTSLLHLIANLNATQRHTGNKPITVMCNDGVGRTGSFLVIHAMMERVKTENILDFFQFVKSSRIHRPNVILELEHYRFCHDTLADFLESLDSYANFKDLSAPNTTNITV